MPDDPKKAGKPKIPASREHPHRLFVPSPSLSPSSSLSSVVESSLAQCNGGVRRLEASVCSARTCHDVSCQARASASTRVLTLPDLLVIRSGEDVPAGYGRAARGEARQGGAEGA